MGARELLVTSRSSDRAQPRLQLGGIIGLRESGDCDTPRRGEASTMRPDPVELANRFGRHVALSTERTTDDGNPLDHQKARALPIAATQMPNLRTLLAANVTSECLWVHLIQHIPSGSPTCQ